MGKFIKKKVQGLIVSFIKNYITVQPCTENIL